MRNITHFFLTGAILLAAFVGCNKDNPDDYAKPKDRETYVAPETVDRSNGNFLPKASGEFEGDSGTDVFGEQ